MGEVEGHMVSLPLRGEGDRGGVPRKGACELLGILACGGRVVANGFDRRYVSIVINGINGD